MSNSASVEPLPYTQSVEPLPGTRIIQPRPHNQNIQPHPEYPSPSAQEEEVHQFLLEMIWYMRRRTLPVMATHEHCQLVQKFVGNGANLYEMHQDEMQDMFGGYGNCIFSDLHHGSPWGMSNNIWRHIQIFLLGIAYVIASVSISSSKIWPFITSFAIRYITVGFFDLIGDHFFNSKCNPAIKPRFIFIRYRELLPLSFISIKQWLWKWQK